MVEQHPAEHPIVGIIRTAVRLVAFSAVNATASAVARARGLVSEHFASEAEWALLVALAAGLGAEATAAYLLGAQFPTQELHYVLAVLLFVAGGGEPSEVPSTLFPA